MPLPNNIQPLPMVPQAAPQGPAPKEQESAIPGLIGFGADTGEKALESVGEGFKDTARELKHAAKLEPGQIARAMKSDAKELKSMAKDAEELGGRMHVVGKIATVVDAGMGAYSAYKDSDFTNTAGKLADGALGAGSKLLAGAAWPVAAADAVTGGQVSKLYFAGGKAIEALAFAATGDFGPAYKFNAEAVKGGQGLVAEGLSRGMAAATDGAAMALDGLGRWF